LLKTVELLADIVVAPAEGVVDAAAVGARDVALEVAGEPTEQVDLVLVSPASDEVVARSRARC
jgi:hypothetical protein